MTCTCPKCNAEIELEVAGIPAEGSFHKCSACSTNLEIRRESFAKRALYTSSDIACAECGNPPGPSIYCQSCHAIYPEILVIEKSSAGKKQLGKLLASFNKAKKLKKPSREQVHHDYVSAAPAAAKGKGGKRPGQPAQLAVILAVILVAALAGGYFWYQDKLATEYSQQYVRTLLGMKLSRDLEASIGSRVAANWKPGAPAAMPAADLKSLATAKSDVDSMVKRMGPPPEKFAASSEALSRLSDSFGKLHTAVSTTTGTPESYAAAVKRTDDEFMKGARELKSGLPGKIADTLETSRKKFKTLQDF